jgi:hypothetical protein
MRDLRFTLETFHAHAVFDCEGSYSEADLLELIDIAARTVVQKKVLFDLNRLTGDMDTMTRYALGMAIAKRLGDFKVAVLGDRSKINKVGENTAVNRGASMFVTDDYTQAMEWLLK